MSTLAGRIGLVAVGLAGVFGSGCVVVPARHRVVVEEPVAVVDEGAPVVAEPVEVVRVHYTRRVFRGEECFFIRGHWYARRGGVWVGIRI